MTQRRSGQLRLARQTVELTDLAALVTTEFQTSFATHAFSMSRLDRPALVIGDALRLGQVLRNLLSKAVKYSPGGGTIRIEVTAAESAFTLSVADEGVGIDPQLIARIFERYYRVETATSSGIGGLGIGLFIVQEIVRLHGGSISVESQLGAGSRFIVTLPAASDAPAQLPGL